ncbi:hypothetical protein GO495_14410 [Chitinophaga oryziterrae]|uniref:Uncharacterized protein n=1 Tax=Chitinophaga oryziterrae TaxID=1031224 RepID=A0A6N8JBY6_9BACT|nr:hypothetical protein [Chitinophaga oryziterrae]MVT41779.1 hypothetical protein [Chitinophaga oryziterrae]
MKKWTAILLFSIYAIGSTELDQLLRLPLLVKHFIRHKEENSGITIAAFIKIHYIDEQPYDVDYEQDMQLPFKKADCHCIILPSLLPPPIATVYHTITPARQEYVVFNDSYIPLPKKDTLFKPPRA